MTDPEPTPADSTAESTPPLPARADGTVSPADVESAPVLQRSVRKATLGLAAYTVVALGWIGWSLRRGRLSDALLLLVAMAVTLPPILSYRRQLRKRLWTLAGGAATAEPGAPSDPTGDLPGGAGSAEETTGPAASLRSEA